MIATAQTIKRKRAATPKVTLIPACGYIRMSSAQQEDSPEQQREQIEEYAAEHGYRIVRWYEDLGISGDDSKKRTGFRQMICDAENDCDFEVIITWKTDRFGRFDSLEAGKWITPLRESGVKLVTVTEGLQD